LVFGGDFKRLLLYLFISWMGFWVGDFVSRQIGLRLFTVGLLNLGFSIIGSLIFLFIAFWLGMENPETNNKKQ